MNRRNIANYYIYVIGVTNYLILNIILFFYFKEYVIIVYSA